MLNINPDNFAKFENCTCDFYLMFPAGTGGNFIQTLITTNQTYDYTEKHNEYFTVFDDWKLNTVDEGARAFYNSPTDNPNYNIADAAYFTAKSSQIVNWVKTPSTLMFGHDVPYLMRNYMNLNIPYVNRIVCHNMKYPWIITVLLFIKNNFRGIWDRRTSDKILTVLTFYRNIQQQYYNKFGKLLDFDHDSVERPKNLFFRNSPYLVDDNSTWCYNYIFNCLANNIPVNMETFKTHNSNLLRDLIKRTELNKLPKSQDSLLSTFDVINLDYEELYFNRSYDLPWVQNNINRIRDYSNRNLSLLVELSKIVNEPESELLINTINFYKEKNNAS